MARHFLLLIGIIILPGFCTYLAGQPSLTRNSVEDIDSREGKIKLIPVRTWGGDQTDDENQFFRIPNDIKINTKGVVYIVDSYNHRIQVFNSSGAYLKTLGEAGQGPTNLYFPASIAFDKDQNIVTADSHNFRVQTFNPEGKYVYSFRFGTCFPNIVAVNSKNQILVYSQTKTDRTGTLITACNEKGQILREIGKTYHYPHNKSTRESISFDVDSNDNIFVAYYAAPFYWKYSKEGTVLQITSYDRPGKAVRFKNGKYETQGDLQAYSSFGFAVEKDERVFLVTATRAQKKSEIYYLTGSNRFPLEMESENTDMFRLLVFNRQGKVIAAKRLNVFCNRIYIHDRDLFIIDSYIAMKIYQFKMVFE